MNFLNKSGVLPIKGRKHKISATSACYVHILFDWSCFDAIQIVKNTFPKDTFSAPWTIMIVFIKYYSNVNETLTQYSFTSYKNCVMQLKSVELTLELRNFDF